MRTKRASPAGVIFLILLWFASNLGEALATSPEGFLSVSISGETVTTSELADFAMPNKGLHGSLRGYGAPALDLSFDLFGYLQLVERSHGDLWTTNVMAFVTPRFYLRHPKNLSGVFVATGIGAGWKSIIFERMSRGVSLGTETTDYFAITGLVGVGFNLMFTRRWGIEGAYYRSTELLSADKFGYRQFTLGLTFGLPN